MGKNGHKWKETVSYQVVLEAINTMPAEDLEYTAKWVPATNTPYEIYVYTQNTDKSYTETVFEKPMKEPVIDETTGEIYDTAIYPDEWGSEEEEQEAE